MTTKTSYKKKYLNQVVLAVILSGLGISANAADLTLDGGSVTIGLQSSTVASTGIATQVTGVPAANYGIPSFNFTMTPSSDLVDGNTYKFKLAVTFDDDNSDSRVEVYIPALNLTVSKPGGVTTLTGVLDNSTQIRVLARDDDGSINVNALVNIPGDSPITVANNQFSFNMSKVVTAISANASINAVVSAIGNRPRHFTYTIAMQETTAGGIQLGVGSPLNAFPRIQSSCANNTASQSNAVFTLGSNALASNMTSAYAIQGRYSVTGATGSAISTALTPYSEDCTVPDTGGGTTDPVVTDNTQTQSNNELENALDGEVTEAVVEQVNTASDNAATLAANTANTINNSTTITAATATSALNTLNTVGKSIQLAGTATQKNGTVDTSKAAATITNVASTLAAINAKSTGLSATEKADLNTKVNLLVTSVVKDAVNLIATGSSSANILSVVNASIKIIAQGAAANGNSVSGTVIAQVKALTDKAVTGVIKNLSPTQLAGADTTTPAGLKALMVANPSVLQVALAASANLPAGSSVDIDGVSLTVEEILALNLGGAGQTTGLQGGFNFQAATTGFTVTTDSTTGNMTLSNGTEKYVAANPVSRLVPESVPEGISYLANGTAVLVGNGVATELAPTAFDQTAFSNAVTSAGFQVTYRSNGSISIALAGNERFSGAFAYDNLGTATSCGAVSVTAPTGNPAAADYAFMVKCADGVTQRVTPIADNASFYATLANADLNASTNRNTGVITIKTVGSFKPSFFVTPLSLTDTTFYNANKNADGIAFRASDKNGDGKTDYEVLSADGVQVLYGQ